MATAAPPLGPALLETPLLPAPPRLPMAYYPEPMARQEHWPDSGSSSDSDSGSEDDCRKTWARKTLLAVALAVAVVLILVILYYLFTPRTLARGLARCGWTVYLMKGCGYCREQMSLLDGFDRYILCSGGTVIGGYTDAPPLSCDSIRAFPYWYNTRTGETRTGFQDSAALARMAQW